MSNSKQVSIPGFIHARGVDDWEKGTNRDINGAHFDWFPYDTLAGYINVMPHTLVFELPEGFDIRPAAIIELEKKKAELMAKSQMAVNEIDNQISKLKSLEMAN